MKDNLTVVSNTESTLGAFHIFVAYKEQNKIEMNKLKDTRQLQSTNRHKAASELA